MPSKRQNKHSFQVRIARGFRVHFRFALKHAMFCKQYFQQINWLRIKKVLSIAFPNRYLKLVSFTPLKIPFNFLKKTIHFFHPTIAFNQKLEKLTPLFNLNNARYFSNDSFIYLHYRTRFSVSNSSRLLFYSATIFTVRIVFAQTLFSTLMQKNNEINFSLTLQSAVYNWSER